MTGQKQAKLDALAAAIVADPDLDPRLMIANTCDAEEDFTYLDAKIEALEATARE